MSTQQAPCRPMRPAPRAVHTRRTLARAPGRESQLHGNPGALTQELGAGGALPQPPPWMRREAPGRMRRSRRGQLGSRGGLKGVHPGLPVRRARGSPLHLPLPQTLPGARAPTRPPRTRRAPACACASRRRAHARAGRPGRGAAGRAPRPRPTPGCSSTTRRWARPRPRRRALCTTAAWRPACCTSRRRAAARARHHSLRGQAYAAAAVLAHACAAPHCEPRRVQPRRCSGAGAWCAALGTLRATVAACAEPHRVGTPARALTHMR